MNSLLPTAIALVAFPVTLFGFLPHQITWLEGATAKQCKAHAWPAANHQTMLAWCKYNKYPVE
jgi:hypothetical protein|tara:strand:- start:4991 stop:5179 length:189 start_codon:yes stop_codon:yes gene_type:complete